MRIAIVGSGVAGLGCAHLLGPHHDVVLYEADDRLGGHANTVDVEDPVAGRIGIDTGFIVHNDRNYPHLVRLFDELGVEVSDTEMSFGVLDADPGSSRRGLAYRATNLDTLFADRANLRRSTIWRMLIDIARFYRHANRFLATGRPPGASTPLADPEALTTAEFLERGGYGSEFVDLHLIPMGAAVWSAEPSTFDAFPAASLFRFLSNHGLLGIGRRPQWRTIVGGSRAYVDAIAARFEGDIRRSSPVERIGRRDEEVAVLSAGPDGGDEAIYDTVILACHAPQALALLADATPLETELLGAFRTQPNRATLHTDTSILPPNPKTWAAWNYARRSPAQSAATLTYDLTLLQDLPGSERYLVSLNSEDSIDPSSILASIDYAHPVFDTASVTAQARLGEINRDDTWFCGAWTAYGFHEDGFASAVGVCRALGVAW